jgi:NAD(P)-dependent dehydrogenase (short-subunit alcohol dehydrogenase family)
MTSFAGRHVVVTGGTGALGEAVIGRLLDEGATCHVPARQNAPAGFALAGRDRVVVAAGVDVSDAASVDAFYDSLPQLWASVHIAGGFAMSPMHQTAPAEFEQMIAANARTAFLCCRAAVRRMLAQDAGGRIVNVTARPGIEPRRGAGMVAYAASKAAVAAMTVALAEEVKAAGILVNAVAPSTLDTAANRAAMPKADFSKWVSLDSAAETIVDLASPRNLVASGALVPLYAQA